MMHFSGLEDGAMVQVTQEYESDLDRLAEIRLLVEKACREAWNAHAGAFGSCEEALLGQLLLAVQEAATNVIRHAYHGRKGQPLHVEVEATADQLTVVLHYRGPPFDPSAVAPPCFDGSRTGGFGVYLIPRLVDAVSYHRDEAGRCAVRMLKQRRREEHASPSRCSMSGWRERTMQITVDKVGNAVVVTPHLKELDASNADDFKQAVSPALLGSTRLVLDLKKVEFVDSSGCGAILSCLKHLTEVGGDLSICGVRPQVRNVFELIRLHRICEIRDTREEALQALGA